MEAWTYFIQRYDLVIRLTLEHLQLVFLAIIIAIVVGIVLGILASYSPFLANIIIPFTQVMMTVPSIALIGLLIPLVGIGLTNATIGLVIYSMLAIVRNTYTGLKEIPSEIVEAATGMGMREWRILFKIKIPLILPVIIAGIRTSVVMIIGIGAIMAFVGAGGLGELILRGIDRTRNDMVVVGAIFISALSIIADMFLGKLETRFVSK